MVRFWCADCNTEHDNARDCPSYQSLGSLPKGSKMRKSLKDHKRRQSKADYRAPKGASNAVNDGCAVTTLALLGGLASIPVGVWYFLS